MSNIFIHPVETTWVVIARMVNGKREILADKNNEFYQDFPSIASAMQWMKAQGWSDEQIAEVMFLPVENL